MGKRNPSMTEIKKIDKVHKWTKEIHSPSHGPTQKQTRERKKKQVCLGYRDVFFMPIKAPGDANPRKMKHDLIFHLTYILPTYPWWDNTSWFGAPTFKPLSIVGQYQLVWCPHLQTSVHYGIISSALMSQLLTTWRIKFSWFGSGTRCDIRTYNEIYKPDLITHHKLV